jgi:hypothetical protein
MTKEEYLKICYEDWEKFEKLKESTGLYYLEVKAIDIIQATVGKAPTNRRKKKQ